MAPKPGRLSAVSYSGPYPSLSISDEQFRRLQQIYKVELSADDRTAVQIIANEFLRWRLLELVSARRVETKNLFQQVKNAVGPFIKFAEGGLLGKGDAADDLESNLAEHYDQLFICVQPNHIRFQMEDGSLQPPDIQHPILVSLNATVLMNVAHGLVRALTSVERAIEQDEVKDTKGFAPGLAFHDFLLQLRDWAKTAGHPISPFSQAPKSAPYGTPDKLASPFSEFIYALSTMLGAVAVPEGVRSADGSAISSLEERVENAMALAERLKLVATEANSNTGQGGR